MKLAMLIVAWNLGVQIKQVSIVPNATSRGRVTQNDPKFKRVLKKINQGNVLTSNDISIIQNHAILGMAGSLAEEKFSGRSSHIGAKGDYEKVFGLIMQFTGSTRASSAFWGYCTTLCEDLFTTENGEDTAIWKLTTKVAKALLKRKALSNEEFLNVIDDL